MSNYESHAGHRRSCAYTKAVDARVELYPAPHTRYKDKALIMHTSTTKLTGLGTISKVAYPKYKSLHTPSDGTALIGLLVVHPRTMLDQNLNLIASLP